MWFAENIFSTAKQFGKSSQLCESQVCKILFFTQAVRPGFSFRLSFFFPRSVTNRCLASRAHASLVQRTARIFYRSCRRVKS